MGSIDDMANFSRRLPYSGPRPTVGRHGGHSPAVYQSPCPQTSEVGDLQSVPIPSRLADQDLRISGAAVVGSRSGEAATGPSIRIGTLEIMTAARQIFVQGEPVELGGRAFDLLVALLDAKGEIVSKDDLLNRVWPLVTVIESNLKVQLSLLRRAIGPERWRIKTIAGRGYLLVADDAVSSRTSCAAPIIASSAEQTLVIVVNADRTTQKLVVQAISDITKYFEGAGPSAMIFKEHDEGTSLAEFNRRLAVS